MLELVAPYSAFKTLSHTNTYDKTHTQWICLLSAVDAVRKRKTIQFTVTCVMITIVQKIVILKYMLDHGRSFSRRLSSCLPSVIRRASCEYNQILESSDRNFIYLLVKETLELYHTPVITSSAYQDLISPTKRDTNVCRVYLHKSMMEPIKFQIESFYT
jgi:hypothetical protein